jgi:hypothetical protein
MSEVKDSPAHDVLKKYLSISLLKTGVGQAKELFLPLSSTLFPADAWIFRIKTT